MLMKKSFLLLSGAMIMLTGCDFFRMLAGRPTSEDIENKRVEIIKAKEAAQKARQDSIARVELEVRKAVQDSIDACTFIAENKITLYTVARLGGIQHDGLSGSATGSRYRVVLGSFREKSNADKLAASIYAAGDYQPHLISLRNGMIAVAACPSDKIQNVVSGFKSLKMHKECPSDAWILKVE